MASPTEGSPLAGGTANRGRVIRVGDTVRRPAGPHSRAVHDLLRHLAASGFGGSPRALALDPALETLGYIEGDPATEPLPDWALTEDALVSVGTLLRDYHRHAAGFDPAGRHWQRAVPGRWRGALVAHNDVNPANVIFRDGAAVALIDFDLAAPATAAWDLAVAACFWAPLRDVADIPDRRRDHRLRRFAVLLDAYGADPALRREVADAVGAANWWIAQVIEDAAKQGHPAFGKLWQREHGVHVRAADWLAGNAGDLRRVGQA